MTLRLPAHWLWDFWFAVDGDDVHLFLLHAPRSLGEPDLRHHNARIGHAVSSDLRTWKLLPRPIEPGPRGAFDDLATWTGMRAAAERAPRRAPPRSIPAGSLVGRSRLLSAS